MRLVRYEVDGTAAIGILEGEVISEVQFDQNRDDVPQVIAAALNENFDVTGTVSVDDVSLKAPVPRPGKLVCLGLNYRDHAEEGGNEIPEQPLLFSKATSAVVGPGSPIEYPHDVEQLDYEAELAIVIGSQGRHIDRDDALDHVAGFTILNDVSARDVQYAFSQYFRGKSYDTFAPMGPALVTPDEVTTDDLSVRAWVNGDLRQESSTAEMIFPVAETIESVSGTMSLYPGDVIATGTPPGVGVHRDPPLLLTEGDEVTVEIEGLGRLSNPITAAPPR